MVFLGGFSFELYAMRFALCAALQGTASFFMDDTVSTYLSLIHISKPDTGALSPTIEKSRMKS